jgi:4-hydroxy-tetrahydrodipicolinate synthase
MIQQMFSGVITALITPLLNDQIDIASFEKILAHQIKNNIKTVVVGGSTGENATINDNEYKALLSCAVASGLQIIAGCNSSSTAKAIALAQKSQSLGVHGLMVTIPSYNKPTQQGVFEHFNAIHDATSIPIMLYSVPSRTGVDFSDETIFRLCQLPRVLAFKDSGGDIIRPVRIISKLSDRLTILAGDDYNALAFAAHGAKGVVSVASNVIPGIIVKLHDLMKKGDLAASLKLQLEIFPLYQALFSQTNPISIKCAMAIAGFCSDEVRLPLCRLENDKKELLLKELKPFL